MYNHSCQLKHPLEIKCDEVKWLPYRISHYCLVTIHYNVLYCSSPCAVQHCLNWGRLQRCFTDPFKSWQEWFYRHSFASRCCCRDSLGVAQHARVHTVQMCTELRQIPEHFIMVFWRDCVNNFRFPQRHRPQSNSSTAEKLRLLFMVFVLPIYL